MFFMTEGVPVSYTHLKMASGNCENCVNYKYEEDYDCYICDMDLDEDEMVRFLSASFENCPYFQLEDEYGICLLYTSRCV